MFQIHQIPNTDIFEVENFLSVEYCEKLINWFNTQPRTIFANDPFWSDRTINFSRIADVEIRRHIEQNRIDRTLMIRELFNQTLYPDYTDIVQWKTGISMSTHIDDLGYFYYRKISTVVYLNDNFQGGQTFFENHNVEIVPKIGKLVAYPSSSKYPHGVRKVTGDRYTFPMWFTELPSHIEI